MIKNSQKGFALLEVILIVLAVAVVGYLGWRVYTSQQNTDSAAPTTTETDQAPQIDDSSDLEEAENYLNETDIDTQLDTSEIDAALSE